MLKNLGSQVVLANTYHLYLEPGDEVITTPVTDTGGILGIMLQNCIPMFADSDPDTFNIDPIEIERSVTERTRAIIATKALVGAPSATR